MVPRYAPGTLLQAGPGLPDWSYVTYSFDWSGPVEPDQTVRFLYIGPVVLAIWRFAGILLLAALFVALLQVGRGAPWLDRWLTRRTASCARQARALLLFAAIGAGAAGASRRARQRRARTS